MLGRNMEWRWKHENQLEKADAGEGVSRWKQLRTGSGRSMAGGKQERTEQEKKQKNILNNKKGKLESN